MKILVVGSGGREHALAWRCAQDESVDRVLVAPGNAGTEGEHKIRNVDIASDDIPGLIALASRELVDLTIIGPEQPLVAGIVDAFEDAGLRCFGPSAAAAQLEGSKAFSKAFMQRHHIPTAAFRTFEALEPALAYLEAVGAPVVVKADGLAAGKGVVVAQSLEQAETAVRDMLAGNRFGAAGHRVVIEEFVQGEEASFIALCDGSNALPLATSQDHKAAFDGDTGPNTGGMGAYSPAPVVTPALHDKIMAEVINPTLKGMAEEGQPFVGFLYAGVMITPAGELRVLEFNVRFGDPETQPVMMRLQSSLAAHCNDALDGDLSKTPIRWAPQTCLGVVMAASGYPGSYPTGQVIHGLDDVQPPTKVFHAGTGRQGEQTVTAGGRVLCVCGLGGSVAEARDAAYGAVDAIRWTDCQYRSDIGHRALNAT
ncbi:MAG: phosphoribosylamine--glycine ligase [Pseudomonadota bacterium]